MLTVYCPYCGQKHNIRWRTIGTFKDCDRCKRGFVPSPPSEPIGARPPSVVVRIVHGREPSGCAGLLLLLACGVGVFVWMSRSGREENPAEPPAPAVELITVPHPRPEIKPEPKVEAETSPKSELKDQSAENEREASRLLTLARNLEDDHPTDRKGDARVLEIIRTRYTEIIRKYSETKAAGEARKALERLK